MRFEFATATRIVFGEGISKEIGAIAREFGRRALVVTGRNPNRAEPLLAAIRSAGINAVSLAISGEPTVQAARDGSSLARAEACDLVVSIGGGSVLDAGKAIAALATNPGDPFDHLEVIGRGKPLGASPLPFIAVPTTAGTGAEVTRNAVLGSPAHKVKVSLRSAAMLPKVAIVDPELTYDLPPSITATTGLDALTQLIEPYVCSRANPMTDALCIEGIRRARSLRRAVENGRDAEARRDLAVASLFGGLALANAGLGAVHGFAAPIGGMFPAPHGAVCAALLPHVMDANLRALRERQPADPGVSRFEHVARLLTGNPAATADDGVQWIRRLTGELQIPTLSRYGLRQEHVTELCNKAASASSMKANPIALTPAELTRILEAAL